MPPYFGCTAGAVAPPMISASPCPTPLPGPHAFHGHRRPSPHSPFGQDFRGGHSFRRPPSCLIDHRSGGRGRRPFDRRPPFAGPGSNMWSMHRTPFDGKGMPFVAAPPFGGEGMPFFFFFPGSPFQRPPFEAAEPGAGRPFGRWRRMWGIGRRGITWEETAEAYLLKVNVPGIKKEDVKVNVEDGKEICISHQRGDQLDEDDQEEMTEQRGRTMGGGQDQFEWRCRIPKNGKVEEISAAMEDGVLTITVPKVQTAKEAVIVEISG